MQPNPSRPRSARRRALPALLLPLAACGAPLLHADLRPAPAVSVGPAQVSVPVVATTAELLTPTAESLSDDDEIVTLVVVENPAVAPATLDLAAWALVAIGPGGQTIRARPARVYPRRPVTSRRFDRPLAPVVVPPKGRHELWVGFDGLAGLVTTGAIALRLEGPEGRLIPLAAPAAPGPLWERPVAPVSAALRFELMGGQDYYPQSLSLELLRASGRLVLGGAASMGLMRRKEATGWQYRSVNAIGARAGWLPHTFPIGLLAGADLRFVDEPDDPGASPAAAARLVTFTLGLRWRAERAAPRFSPVPLRRPHLPFGPFYVDLAFVRWQGDEDFESGNGVLFAYGIAWVTP